MTAAFAGVGLGYHPLASAFRTGMTRDSPPAILESNLLDAKSALSLASSTLCGYYNDNYVDGVKMRYRGYGSAGFGVVGYIIITCIALYIAVSVNRDLISLFGFRGVDLLEMRQPWTVLTSMFVHAPFPSFSHILFNMLILYFFGSFLVNLVGAKKFLLVYFVGGIAGNIVFMLLNSPFATVIGASGAIFAVEGALVVMRPRLPVIIFPIPVPIPLWASVIGAFVLTSFVASIAWEAHLGGLLVGLVAGYFFRKWEVGRHWH
jgi:membrane associated rhomboid family serine protease